MEPFKNFEGLVVPLDRANVDTDQIIPKQFLKRIERTGYGEFLFFNWRFNLGNKLDPEFELNQNRYQGAEILLTRLNFGCGSSREHAPWALADYGIRSIIAPSFADIFYNNCFKNGLLPIVLPEATVDGLFKAEAASTDFQLTIDLANQQVMTPDGEAIGFEIDEFRKHCLLNGLDEIGLTLQQSDAIREYESRRLAAEPWIFQEPQKQ